MLRFAVALAMIVCISATVRAGTITDVSGMPGMSTTIDFHEFTGSFVDITPAVQVGTSLGFDVTVEGPQFSEIGDSTYLLGGNGQWNSGRVGFVATNNGDGTNEVIFRFNDGPVRAVGGFVNYSPSVSFADFVLEALDASDAAIESFNITDDGSISTPSASNDGAFRGIVRTNYDIYGLRMSGSFGVLDDLTFTPVPQPQAVWGGLALLGIIACGRGARHWIRAAR